MFKMPSEYATFRQCYNAKRDKSQSVEKFIAEFELILVKMDEFEMKLPDSVAAFALLEACNLSGNDSRLVLSGIKDVSLDKMKESIIRVSGGQWNEGIQPAAVKQEAVLNVIRVYSQSSKYEDSRPRRGAGRNFNRSGEFSIRKVNPLG